MGARCSRRTVPSACRPKPWRSTESRRRDRSYCSPEAKAPVDFVTRRGLLLPSKLGRILTDCSGLGDGSLPPARLLAYKGRSYCWLPISPEGELSLPQGLMEQLQLTPGLALLAIRSSDIAFTMGARGPLLERARAYPGEIPAF